MTLVSHMCACTQPQPMVSTSSSSTDKSVSTDRAQMTSSPRSMPCARCDCCVTSRDVDDVLAIVVPASPTSSPELVAATSDGAASPDNKARSPIHSQARCFLCMCMSYAKANDCASQHSPRKGRAESAKARDREKSSGSASPVVSDGVCVWCSFDHAHCRNC
jgi:hypothetical protein